MNRILYCKVLFLTVIIVLVFSGCGKQGGGFSLKNFFGGRKDFTALELTPSEYKKWFNEEGAELTKRKEMDDMIFEIRYNPVDYIISENYEATNFNDSLISEQRREMGGMYYFDFRISLKEGNGELLKYQLGSVNEYEERVNYFAFGMQGDLSLNIGGNKIPCGLFHFERAYDVAPYATFILGFPREDSYEDETEVQFEYHDQVFQKGIIHFIYTIRDLKNTPKVKAI